MAVSVLAAACGQDNAEPAPPSPSAIATGPVETTLDPSDVPQAPVIDVTIADGAVTPANARMRGTVGEPITLRVDSDTPDELHVHSVPEHSFAVEPRRDQEFQFRTEVPGNVEIELHELDQVVATVEVRPRS